MKNVVPGASPRNPIEQLLSDAIADALTRPEVIAALREVLPRPQIEVPAAPRLLTKAALATALSVSKSTVDRLTVEGMPIAAHVGDARRFDLVSCRAFLAERGHRPTRAHRTNVDVDVREIANDAGLRGTR